MAVALELAVRASWYVRDRCVAGLVQPGVKVRLGAGVASGGRTVCGFLSSSGSAHRWSVFGDGATEAITLASYGAHVCMSARALERLQSPSTWGVSYDTGAVTGVPAGMSSDATRDQQQQAARRTVWHKRQHIRKVAKDLLGACKKKPMPLEAVAFGSTVTSTHYYSVPHVRPPDMLFSKAQLAAIHRSFDISVVPQVGAESAAARRALLLAADTASMTSFGEGTT